MGLLELMDIVTGHRHDVRELQPEERAPWASVGDLFLLFKPPMAFIVVVGAFVRSAQRPIKLENLGWECLTKPAGVPSSRAFVPIQPSGAGK